MVCPLCGGENPDRARFCLDCGASLVAVSSVERRERRVVSVLFADLVGFTRRSESLDVEDVEGFLAPYQALLGGCVERTGGVVAKFTGDGVMAVFGGVVAHEDDAERAVRCALAIRDGLAEAEDGAGEGRLRVRVGVTTGEALVSVGSAGSVDAVGDVVNTAARLESAAPVDGVLVDEWTFRATDRVIRYEQGEPVAAKGKTKPVVVWLAVDSRSVVAGQARELLPLVGRDGEATLLRGALDRSMRESSTQLVSVIGEPGIGKTRLVEELRTYVHESQRAVTWRRGRSLAYGEAVALWALGEMVKEQAGILDSDSAEVAAHKLSTAVAEVIIDGYERTLVMRHLESLVGVAGERGVRESGREEAFAAWRRFLEAIAEGGPTVLIFEDIHWADDALLDFIDALVERAGSVPLLVVCTARPELIERRAYWGGGKANAITISLTPLTDDATATVIGQVLGSIAVQTEAAKTLLARSEGNPLYAQEYVRMLQDRGLLVEREGAWDLSGSIPPLPESILGIIAARLDTLTPEEKTLVQDASVVGRTAWIGAVCALTDRTRGEAEERLYSLERKQLMQRVRRSSIHGETEFQFGHALTRDVAYSQIRRADRAQKHLAAAAWIEQLAGERDDKAEMLADHYDRAVALKTALGEDTADLAVSALEAYREAGRQATANFAHRAAARHYRSALALTPPNDRRGHAEAALGLVNALVHAATADEGVLHSALDAQVAAESWEGAAQVEWRLAYWYEQHAGSGTEAEEHLARAAAYAARVPPTDTACLIAAAQARRLLNAGRPAEALSLTSGMIPAAERAGLRGGAALLTGWRGMARVESGDLDGLDDIRMAAETLADEAHERTASVYANLANTLRGLGDMPGADIAYQNGAEWADRLASAFNIDWMAAERAYQAYHAADWQIANQLLGQVRNSNQFAQNGVRLVRGRINLGQNLIDEALADAKILVEYSESTGDDQCLYYGAALAARCHEAAGQRREALDWSLRVLNRWNDVGGLSGCAIELCEVAYVLALERLHAEIREVALLLPDACRWREALLHIADHDYAEAAALYEQIGSHPLAADTHLLAAHKATAERRAADAAQHARTVRAFAEKTGATLYQRQAEQSVAP